MGKVVVITGAGSGLGRAIARRLAADGETVLVLGRTRPKIEAVAEEIGHGALAIFCDVSSPDSVRAAFQTIAGHHSRIDVLINNAALFQPFPVAEAADAQILETIATNFAGPILCARAAIPLLGPGGHIVNVSSESVDLPFPYLTLYQSSKAGLEQFSKGLYRELEPSGIRVTCVRAGQMADADTVWNVDPAMGARFHQAAMQAGLNLMERPISHYRTVAEVFRQVIDLPPDLHVQLVALHARRG